MSHTQWTFIGAGNMASSLIGGLIASGANRADISVVDINASACKALEDKFGISSATNTESISIGASIVIAVKPNIVEVVCGDLAVKQPAMVVSVAAGVLSSSIAQWIKAPTPIVRCMPNTPSLLGLGATAMFANALCSEHHKEDAQALLSTAGKTQWVQTEEELDAVTALSGSGPAYFFYVIEHMAKAAEKLGLEPKLAREFAIETAFGAASMARTQEYPPDVLRKNVTSKGGTTAAALAVFDERNLDQTIEKAMQAAHDRAKELGQEFGS